MTAPAPSRLAPSVERRRYLAFAMIVSAVIEVLLLAGVVGYGIGRGSCPRCVAVPSGRVPVTREIAHGALILTCEGQ